MMTRSVVGIAITSDEAATHDIVYVACDDGSAFVWWPDRRAGCPGRWEELAPVPGTRAARQAHRADDATSGTTAEPGQ